MVKTMPKLKYPCTGCKSEETCGTLCQNFKNWFCAEWYICTGKITGKDTAPRSEAYIQALRDLGFAEVEE